MQCRQQAALSAERARERPTLRLRPGAGLPTLETEMLAALKHDNWMYIDYLRSRFRFGLTDVKHAREFHFWRKRWRDKGQLLRSEHYPPRPLARAGKPDARAVGPWSKAAASIGCGAQFPDRTTKEIRGHGSDVWRAAPYTGENDFNMQAVRHAEKNVPTALGFGVSAGASRRAGT